MKMRPTPIGESMIRNLQYTIAETDNEKTIKTFLKEKGYSTTLLNELKKTPAGIRKNQVRAFVNERLNTGDILEICMEEIVEEGITAIPGEFVVLYEDEDLLVVDKPHHMPIHPSINHYENTLANAAAYYFKQKDEACVFRCINRLDRDTTGATILAKNALSAGVLSDQVMKRKIHRTYHALVEGMTKEEGTVDLPIGRKEGSVIERQVDLINGKRAVTHYKRLQVIQSQGKEISLLELQLETGRTHQIRVHMAYIGHPLLGDFLYNEHCKRMDRQALHSAKLCFTHPITGMEMEVKAPLPEDMNHLLETTKV